MQKNSTSLQTAVLITVLSTCLFSFGCSKASSDDSNSNPVEVPEAELCSTTSSYTTYSTLNGTATFSKRGLQTTLSGSQVERFRLGALVTGIPIRFAEVRVLNPAGSVVQCGRTNSSGALKGLDGTSDLRIPDTAGTYTVEVLSRTNYNPTVPGGKPAFTVLFSVKESIYSNTVYKATASVTTSGAGTYNNVNSNATGAEGISAKIEGGAFNIYNDVITSYEYLANNTGTQNISCLNPKMSIYWQAGFNPAQYIYPKDDPGTLGTVSFYIRTDKELYISGGRMGNVTSQDTDHFDDSVIIHELGHHIENVCGTMDSPGGGHSGAAIIDARLAWSEAWGNFFGAHIIKNNTTAINPSLGGNLPGGEWLYYVDTQGYTDGSVTTGYEYLKFNLARKGNVNTRERIYDDAGSYFDYDFDRVYSSTYPGEGHFREVAISRGLFKSTNSCLAPFGNCANQNNFTEIWKAFDKTTGMGQSAYPFRSSVRFLERYQFVNGALSGGLTTIFETDEAMHLAGSSVYESGIYKTWAPYGIKLIKSVSACNLKIQPQAAVEGRSNQRFSNHFYYLDKNLLTGVSNIYITGGASLAILAEGYRYTEGSGATSVDISSATSRSLLNVRATGSSEQIYTLRDQPSGGNYLCPINPF